MRFLSTDVALLRAVAGMVPLEMDTLCCGARQGQSPVDRAGRVPESNESNEGTRWTRAIQASLGFVEVFCSDP